MAEHGNAATPRTTPTATFHRLIMNTLCKIEELPRDPRLLCRSGPRLVNLRSSKPDGSATGRRSKPTGAQTSRRTEVRACEDGGPKPSVLVVYGVVVDSVNVSALL